MSTLEEISLKIVFNSYIWTVFQKAETMSVSVHQKIVDDIWKSSFLKKILGAIINPYSISFHYLVGCFRLFQAHLLVLLSNLPIRYVSSCREQLTL